MTINTHKGDLKASTCNEIYREVLDKDVILLVKESWAAGLEYTLQAGVVSPKKKEWGSGVISYGEVYITDASTSQGLPPLRNYTTKHGYLVKEVAHKEVEFKTGDYDMMTQVSAPFFRRYSKFTVEGLHPQDLIKYKGNNENRN